jgi:hypothetical protein
VADNVADPSVGPEQHVIDADTAHALRNLVGELPPRRRSVLRALFTDNPAPTPRSPTSPDSPSAASGRPAPGHSSSSDGRPTSADSDRRSDHEDSERLRPRQPAHERCSG